MKKTRRLLLALSVLLLSATAKAGVGYLVLTEQTGTVTTFALADKPVMTTTGGNLSITTTGKEITVAIPEVKDITFNTEDPSGIEAIHTGKPALANGTAAFSGLPSGGHVAVYSTDGTMVDSATANADGSCTVDLNRLPHGVYIIKTPGATYKVTNR